jgi:predicted ATPase
MGPKKFWVKGFKSLRDVAIEFPTRLTVLTGSSGSGKTALTEVFDLLRNDSIIHATVGVEIWDGECYISYELDGSKKMLITNCNPGEAEDAVRKFVDGIIVIRDVDWKAVRSLQPAASGEAKLLPDASNFLPFLYSLTGGEIPDSLVEAVRYVLPSVSDLRLVAEGGTLVLKLTTEGGIAMTQATMPSGVLKTLIVETALMAEPSMLIVDNFECGLDQEAQQFLLDEFRSHDVYALVVTNSETVLDYVKSPREVVLLRLENGETKAKRLGDEVEEALKRHKLTLSELLASGLLESF